MCHPFEFISSLNAWYSNRCLLAFFHPSSQPFFLTCFIFSSYFDIWSLFMKYYDIVLHLLDLFTSWLIDSPPSAHTQIIHIFSNFERKHAFLTHIYIRMPIYFCIWSSSHAYPLPICISIIAWNAWNIPISVRKIVGSGHNFVRGWGWSMMRITADMVKLQLES